MGLFKELILLPAAPLRFTVWVADKVAEEAEEREFSPAAGVQKIEELEEKRERGEISEDEAAEAEGQILEQQVATASQQREAEEGDGSG